MNSYVWKGTAFLCARAEMSKDKGKGKSVEEVWKKNSLSAGKTLSQEGEGKGEGEGKAQARAVCSSDAVCSSGAEPRRKWSWPRMAKHA